MHFPQVRTYDVVPISPSLGMVVFVPGTKPLKALLTDPALVPADAIAAADSRYSTFILTKGGNLERAGKIALTPDFAVVAALIATCCQPQMQACLVTYALISWSLIGRLCCLGAVQAGNIALMTMPVAMLPRQLESTLDAPQLCSRQSSMLAVQGQDTRGCSSQPAARKVLLICKLCKAIYDGTALGEAMHAHAVFLQALTTPCFASL